MSIPYTKDIYGGIGNAEQQTNIKFLQINCNKSRQGHDLALATAKTKLLLLSEPNISAIRGSKDWIQGEDLRTATNKDPVKNQGHYSLFMLFFR